MLILALTYTHAHAPYYRASLLRRFVSSNLEKRKLWVKTFRAEKVKNWTHGKGPHQTSRARARLKRVKEERSEHGRERERDYRSRRLEETRHKAPPCLPDAKPMLLFPCPPSRTSTTIRITLLCAWRIPTPFNANPTRVER